MTTNILATIVVTLVTNSVEQIIPYDHSWSYTIPVIQALPMRQFDAQWFPQPPPRPREKTVMTDVNEMKLLITEAEGLKFTNILSNVLKLRTRETFVEEVPPPPPAKWVLQPEKTSVETNWPAWDARPLFLNFSTGVLSLTNTTNHFIEGK